MSFDNDAQEISSMAFEFDDGSFAYIGKVNVAVVDIPPKEGGN